MIKEAAASNHVAMVVQKTSSMLQTSEWGRSFCTEGILPQLNWPSFNAYALLHFHFHCTLWDSKLQKTTSCSSWKAMHSLKASHGVPLIQSMATIGIHYNWAGQLQTSEQPHTLSWTHLMSTHLCINMLTFLVLFHIILMFSKVWSNLHKLKLRGKKEQHLCWLVNEPNTVDYLSGIITIMVHH